MSEGLQVFLVSLDNSDRCIVYSDPLNQQVEQIYNAGSLQLMPDPNILAFTAISGLVTPSFGVKPLILGYANGLFEVLYAPTNSPYLFRSDGSIARHDRSQVKAKSIIEIPNLQPYVLDQLEAVALLDPNEESIQRYIQMSYQGMEYNTNRTYHEMTPAAPPTPPDIPAPVSRPAASESTAKSRSPSPRPRRSAPRELPSHDYEEQLKSLQQKVDDLEKIIETMNRRSYKLYPVDLPTEFRIGSQMTPVISIPEIQKKMADGEIERVDFIPSLQPYAGSNRSNNRFITYYGKNGSIYHVRADYDPKTNEINPPK